MSPRLFHKIAQAHQNLFRSADNVCSTELDVSGTQVVALFAIKGEDGCQMKDLARLMQLKNSAITGLTSRMEENGLIVRQPCADDGRASRLYVSDKGHAVLKRAHPLLNAINGQLKKGFSAEELEVVARFLDHAISINFYVKAAK